MMFLRLVVHPRSQAPLNPLLHRMTQTLVSFDRPVVMLRQSEHSDVFPRAVVMQTAREATGAA